MTLTTLSRGWGTPPSGSNKSQHLVRLRQNSRLGEAAQEEEEEEEVRFDTGGAVCQRVCQRVDIPIDTRARRSIDASRWEAASG